MADMSRDCNCGRPQELALNPAVPVELDPRTGDFLLMHSDGVGLEVMRHCCWCGGRLRRDPMTEYTGRPDPVEREEARMLSKDIRGIEDVKAILGDAQNVKQLDAAHLEEEPPTGSHLAIAMYAATLPLRLHCFSRRWKTIDLFVAEFANGSVTTITRAKPTDKE